MSVMVTYRMPQMGLGTDFSEFDRPINFASIYTNRFRNITGGAERRPGMSTFSSAAVPGFPNLTRLHEFVSNTGEEALLTSDDRGNIWKFNTSSAVWDSSLTGKSNARLISAEADDKLIFVNGVDRNFYTDDAGATYKELKSLIATGILAGGSNTTTVIDGNISDWINNTLVSNNDIVFNVTNGGYGVVTAVSSASLTITAIGSAANGAGKVSQDQKSGDAYQLIDYVSLNVVPNGAGGFTDIGTAANGTLPTIIAVSAVNFAATEIRRDDIVFNTSQNAIALVNDVSANISLKNTITGQVPGDALVFFKSAMPIASWIHVHYGRVAYLDARNGRRIVFSAPDDPQDVTTFQKTLDSSSFSFSTQQPEGDVLLSMNTFLSYFVAAGKRNLFIYQGDTPIQDSIGTTINFTPIAFYPNGVATRFGLETNGGDLLHVTVDGVQAINIGFNNFSVNQNNASVPILNTLRQAINATPNPDDIQLTYYPRRRWLINKIGDQCYILNTQPSYDATGTQQQIASWHLFNGMWAQQNHYFVRENGDLMACGPQGGVYFIDSSASTDVGTPITTDLQTAWLRLEEPQVTPRIKEGHYIRPVFESSSEVEYTINVRAGLDNFSGDSITVSAGGTGAIGTAIVGVTEIGGGSFAEINKYSLRWRGEQFRVEFITESSAAKDIITSFVIEGNIAGKR